MENSDVIFVAVGKELGNYRSTLRWVMKNSWGVKICIIYVHVPSQTILSPTGGEVPATQLGEQDLAEIRKQERKEMDKTTDYYTEIIGNITTRDHMGISHSANSIEEGIVEVISLKMARRLVMGAAPDIGYIRGMAEPTSTKAKYVHQHAPDYCQIQFICKGELICTREAVETSNPNIKPIPLEAVLPINEPETVVDRSEDDNELDIPLIRRTEYSGGESSRNGNIYDQLEQAISRAGYSITQKTTEVEEICQEYLAKRLRDVEQQRDMALEEAKQLRKQLDEKSSTPKSFSYFSASDVKKVTNNFDASTIIGEGGYGFVYKGMLGETEVAIKIPKPDGKQGQIEFKQEIDALSNLRHPNMVTLVGACLESRALIYLYLPGGSLEDRLITCKDESLPPLPWQTRIQIAIELCSVVAFLHSNPYCSLTHGDLKPSNILLDEKLVCKLSDFGLCHMSLRSGENFTESSVVAPLQGSIGYLDPEFFVSQVLSKKSDVYSIGVILLQLLTGKQATNIANIVRKALNSDNVNVILDPSAGEWPSSPAIELSRMALSCCEMTKEKRPAIVEVLRFLKLIKALCMGLSTPPVVSDGKTPTYFLCPIFQEVMKEPHFASDGFTYEKMAIEGWLEFGRDSSPMTNDPLQDTNIVPNRALRSAIQEWLQQKDSL